MTHFIRSEYACKCGCGFDAVDYELDDVMDNLRGYFNRPIRINRGSSCVQHNDRVQLNYNENYVYGTSTSQHLYAKACDFVVEGVHADLVADYLEAKYPKKYGIGRYNGRTHLDVRATLARWDKRRIL